ncbi:P27 family phage terminase small subunit [Methylicorpusculum oleiharenae]|uniref:P27 family phage terminase small subunit n=1 Tax=Methylicorpusculum oleiharenae TaxID=1338687 RepID=UPI001359E6CF|nr:P27 family phage terminase small subunit [Methylicorpusculum oleiharenae]MCD2449720.1 P27 family phage terminase small subunit [Methylicorpusculum oleiharenae]
MIRKTPRQLRQEKLFIPLTVNQEDIETAERLKPDWLDAEEGAIWDRLAPLASFTGRLTEQYSEAFAEYCCLRVRIINIRRELNKTGWFYVTEGRHGEQRKLKPEAMQYNDDYRKWQALSSKFGMTPGSVKNLKVVEPEEDDGFDAL